MSWITLHCANDGQEVRVNMALAICMNGDDKDTCVEFALGEKELHVREKPEEIMAMIREESAR